MDKLVVILRGKGFGWLPLQNNSTWENLSPMLVDLMHSPSLPPLQLFDDTSLVVPFDLALLQRSYLMMLEVQQQLSRILLYSFLSWGTNGRTRRGTTSPGSFQYLGRLDKFLGFSTAGRYRCQHLQTTHGTSPVIFQRKTKN